MRVLLDSHTVIWAVDAPMRLGPNAEKALQESENELLLSAGTIWELSIKMALGKLILSQPFGQWMSQAIADLGVTILPITVENAEAQAMLPFHHRDPFDRLFAAQAQIENVPVVSNDPVFERYGLTRIW